MRSRTSWEVAEEAKENWLPHMVENSSEACSEMELVTLTEEGALGGLEGMSEIEEGGVRALETSREEALHDLDRNSIGTRGLSGKCLPLVGRFSFLRNFIVRLGSMCQG